MYLASVILQNMVWGTQILLVAVCLYIVYASSRVIHIAAGTIGAASAYLLYLGLNFGWPVSAAILLAIAGALILGTVSAAALEPFAEKQKPLLGLLVSFGFVLVIESIVAIFFGSDGKSLQAGILPVIGAGGVQIDLPGFATIIIGLVFALLAWMAVHFTATGRLLRSVAEKPALAVSLGVNTSRVRRFVHWIAALVAALVVILAGWHTALTPQTGFQIVVAAFIALLMGGAGDIRGTILASYVLAIIPGLIVAYGSQFSENWRLVFVFLLAAVILAIRPRGLFGKQLRES